MDLLGRWGGLEQLGDYRDAEQWIGHMQEQTWHGHLSEFVTILQLPRQRIWGGGPQLHWSEAAAPLADQQQAPAPDAGAPSETLAALDPRIPLPQVKVCWDRMIFVL